MKKLLSTFIIWFIWLISFCSAETVENLVDNLQEWTLTIAPWKTAIRQIDSSDYGVYCLQLSSFDNGWRDYQMLNYYHFSSNYLNSNPSAWNYLSLYWDQIPLTVCIRVNQPYLVLRNPHSNDITIDYQLFRLDVLLDTDLPECNWDWSALYINDIQHQSAWTINITIPEEFSWDYTWDDEEFNLNVIGYNVDTAYIEWIITNQTTKPNQTDLNNIITWVIPLFVPWLVIILFIYFIFKFLKKIF